MIISIICPLYYGKKYVRKIINMVEENYNIVNTKRKVDIELILVNDCNEQIEISSEINRKFTIKFFQNMKNEGIHYSRIRGLHEARGEYVLFLDQDDDIEPRYILSQIENIGDYDAVVCNGIHNGRVIYYSQKMLMNVGKIENYLAGENKIASPGQVLIKRESVPTEWENNVVKANGADDYFLWILMLVQNKKFACDYEILYKHNNTGSNTSDNFQMMEDSVVEVADRLYSLKMITQAQSAQIKSGPVSYYRDNAKLMKLYLRSSRVQGLLDCWLTNKEKQLSCEKYLKEQGVKSVVVYGCGTLGRHLINELQGGAIKIEAVIDKDLSRGKDEIKTINIGDSISANAVIIITPVLELHDIEQKLCKYYDNEIIYIDQLIENMQ